MPPSQAEAFRLEGCESGAAGVRTPAGSWMEEERKQPLSCIWGQNLRQICLYTPLYSPDLRNVPWATLHMECGDQFDIVGDRRCEVGLGRLSGSDGME